MKLFLIHCGFYDTSCFDGVFESHTNFFVVAADFEEARRKAKEHPAFKEKRMHVDGLQELEAVDGFRLHLEADASLAGETRVISHKHRDLAPKPASVAKA